MLKLTLVLPFLAAFALVACSGDDDAPAATPTLPAGATATAPAASTPSASPTRAATVTTPATTPPVDGTVAPEGFGGTDPVTVKSNPNPTTKVAILTDVRVGAHPELGGWDRIVFEFVDVLPQGDIRYVTSASGCGSGEPVLLPGTAILQVKFDAAAAHNDAGQSTIDANKITGPGNVILESVQTCDFEADVTWAIGVKSMQRFKVTTLSSPTRVVIDIKQ